jgi:hypothetical protein
MTTERREMQSSELRRLLTEHHIEDVRIDALAVVLTLSEGYEIRFGATVAGLMDVYIMKPKNQYDSP